MLPEKTAAGRMLRDICWLQFFCEGKRHSGWDCHCLCGDDSRILGNAVQAGSENVAVLGCVCPDACFCCHV